jgi:hypothetical protein
VSRWGIASGAQWSVVLWFAAHAITTLPTEQPLDDARYAVIGALSRLLDGRPSQGKIEEAKASIEDWMSLLKAASAIDYRR